MKLDIPEHCHIRWQAALAVLEDLEEDEKAPFDMTEWLIGDVSWEEWSCGSAACYAGWMAVSPYCLQLGLDKYGDHGYARATNVKRWLIDSKYHDYDLSYYLFGAGIDGGSRTETLTLLKDRLTSTFKESTGKTLTAPMTFWV